MALQAFERTPRVFFEGRDAHATEREYTIRFVRLMRMWEDMRAAGVIKDYAVVGGFALMAHSGTFHTTEQRASCVRRDGTVRDVDFVILDNVSEDVVERMRDGSVAIYGGNRRDISITTPLAPGMRHRGLFRQLACDARGTFSLVFHDIVQPVDGDVMATEQVSFGDARVRTFAPSTLLHLYLTRTGTVKEKDVQKIRNFARIMRRQGKLALGSDHAPYRAFHDFAHEIRRRYPMYTRAMQFLTMMDHFCGGAINHSRIATKIVNTLR